MNELVRTVSRFAIVGVIGSMAAACSSDALRFSETPFSNPFASGQDGEPKLTGSTDKPVKTARLPHSSVKSAPLPPPVATAAAAAPAKGPVAVAALNPARPSAPAAGGWRAEGGTTITVGRTDTLATISNRYGVPPKAILAANGISASQVAASRKLLIPVYHGGGTDHPASVVAQAPEAPAPAQGRVVARAPLPVAAKPAPVKVAAAPAEKHHVRPGQEAAAKPQGHLKVAKAADPKAALEPKTTASIEPKAAAKAHPTTARAKLAQAAPQPEMKPVASKAKPEPKPEKASVGKVVKSEPIPAPAAKAAKVAAAKPAPAEPAPAKVAAKPALIEPQPVKAAAVKVVAPQKVAAIEPAKPVVQAEAPKPAPATKEPESTGALPAHPVAPSAEFRWPARGRVISGFGGTGTNEGINIAVPDGTPVKAAEAGTVAYAGSEVKGYGNLVLIRHDNGYVSAYAHNGDIDVKRGQKVSRGQTIAKSGQSGNVTSPQLHFEIRKGSTPIDPMPYLASN